MKLNIWHLVTIFGIFLLLELIGNTIVNLLPKGFELIIIIAIIVIGVYKSGKGFNLNEFLK